MKLVTVEQMKQLEQAADAAGHSYAEMMEQAGRAVAEAIFQRVNVKNKIVLILVGPGNNGGDGLVAAHYLKQAGAKVICFLFKPRADDDPNMKRVRDQGIACLHNNDNGAHKTLRKALQGTDVIVDALLGTGVVRPIEGALAEILTIVRAAVNERRTPTFAPTDLVPASPPTPPQPYIAAVDVPSGLNCDSGEIDPAALPADLTVTFAAPKMGQFRFPGAGAIGELVVADIGIAPALAQDLPVDVATAQMVAGMLPARPRDAHKGTFGKAMIVAGSVNYTGAAYLAGAAATRVGAGLVTMGVPQILHPILAAKLVEATWLLLPHSTGVLNADAVEVLADALPGYHVLLIGPGLGQDKETLAFVHRLLGIRQTVKGRIGFGRDAGTAPPPVTLPPLVVDADGLNALARVERWWTYLPAGGVLTPHPGEMARLCQTETISGERIAIAAEKSAEWNQVVVLKGAHTVIAAPDGRIVVQPFANAGLARAGTGDVLAGCIAGLMAQGLAAFEAAVCGAYLHGLAGETTAQKLGTAGMVAGDLLAELPHAISQVARP